MRRSIKYTLTTLLLCLGLSSAIAQDHHAIKIAMLHLELKYADLEHNAVLIESGIELAASQGADWVMTPELSLTGYRFDLKIGTEWINNGPDKYVQRMQSLAKQYGVTIFLSHLERAPQIDSEERGESKESELFNTLFVIGRTGKIIGRHRKINTIPISESWSTAGKTATVIEVDQQNVGLLICADAWPSAHAKSLKDQGASIILSSASWAPGEYGPGDTWEKRSRETGVPIFVNNRTGIEREFDLRKSISVASFHGQRLLSHQSPHSQLIMIEWSTKDNHLLSHSTHELHAVKAK